MLLSFARFSLDASDQDPHDRVMMNHLDKKGPFAHMFLVGNYYFPDNLVPFWYEGNHLIFNRRIGSRHSNLNPGI